MRPDEGPAPEAIILVTMIGFGSITWSISFLISGAYFLSGSSFLFACFCFLGVKWEFDHERYRKKREKERRREMYEEVMEEDIPIEYFEEFDK